MYNYPLFPYYAYDRGYHLRPYRYWNGAYHTPFWNYMNSNIARIDQNLYNYGDMSDVDQNANIIQYGSSPVGVCTTSMAPEPLPVPESVYVPE